MAVGRGSAAAELTDCALDWQGSFHPIVCHAEPPLNLFVSVLSPHPMASCRLQAPPSLLDSFLAATRDRVPTLAAQDVVHYAQVGQLGRLRVVLNWGGCASGWLACLHSP